MPPDPTILAFDTATAHCAVAVLLGGSVVWERVEDMARGQAERLLPFCCEALDATGLGWHDLNAIGVCVGPGNFTGVRIAVAAARGLQLGQPQVPAIGVSALEALSENKPGRAIIDARQNRAYVQDFGTSTSEPKLVVLRSLDDNVGPIYCRKGDALAQQGWQTRSTLAPAVARLAAQRLLHHAPVPRPTPLYLRPADAKPSSIEAPRIL